MIVQSLTPDSEIPTGLTFEAVKTLYIGGVKKLLSGYKEVANKLGELEEAYPDFVEKIDEEPNYWKE